jgi:AcrR family transcriptional regulator
MSRTATKGAASRARLLQAAAAAFAEKGFHATKVSDIVAAAGLTQAAFYLYFGSKEAALEELTAGFRTEFGGLIERGLQPAGLGPEQILAAARTNLGALFRFLAADPDRTRVAFFVTPAAEVIKQEAVGLVARNLAANQAAGYLRPDLAPDIAAECLVGMVERLAARLHGPGRPDPEALGRQVADTFFSGVLNAREV